MKNAYTKIAYTGGAVNDGIMEVEDFAPALLSLGKLVRAANETLNHPECTLKTYIKADVQKGSFEVNIEVVQTIVEKITALFSDDGYSIERIFCYIFGGAVTTEKALGSISKSGNHILSLVDLYKKLKGSKIKKIENGDLIEIAGEQFVVDSEILKLYENADVRKNIEKVVAPLSEQGIDGFEFRDEESKTLERINAGEQEYFKYVQDIEEKNTEIDIKEEIMFLTILSPSFDGNKWRLHDGMSSSFYSINDEEFNKKIKQRELTFGSGTTLRCERQIKQEVTADGLKTEYIITKVIEVINPPQQISLGL